MAKQVVQIRKQKEKLAGAQSKLGTLKTSAVTMKANHTVASTMSSTAKTMQAMNKTMNPSKMQDDMRNFERMMAQQGMNEELMDDMLAGEFEEEEVDDVVNQTLLELGVDLTKGMQTAPTHSVKQQREEAEEDAEVEKLMREMLKG